MAQQLDNAWIDIKTNTPPKQVMVQVIEESGTNKKNVNVGEYLGNEEWAVFTTFGVYESSYRTKRVTHWQPMAPLYQ